MTRKSKQGLSKNIVERSMTQLHALILTKAQLDQIPEDERLFYFMAGQLHNDLNILSKFLIAASNEMKLVFNEPPKRSGATAQALLLLKLTAGRLYEGHKMISKTFSAKGLLKKYKNDLSSDALKNLDKLNKYFGSKSLVQHIRTRFAFHSDAESIALAHYNLPSEFRSVEYLSEYPGHKLFRTSETLSFAAIAATGRGDWQLVTDNMCVVFEIFIMGFFEIIYKVHLGLTTKHLEAVTIADDPSVDEMRLPFFCLPPR
jgi:hypothetical protein